MRKSLLQALLPPLIAALFLAVVIALGKVAHDALRGGERTSIAFADIDCPPPPGQERADFLGEVQYLGGLPDRVNVLDDGLPERLAGAFAKHPWVEKVERVEVVLPRKVRVDLVHRTPVLAVSYFPDSRGGRINGSFLTREADRHGILLPASASTEGLADFLAEAPAGPAGAPWGDPDVEAAAAAADYLRPHQDGLRLQGIEMQDGSLVLSNVSTLLQVLTGKAITARVLWGHPPGQEQADEAPAAEKVKRLLDYCDQHGGLGSEQEPVEHDVRPRDQAIHRPLPQRPFSGGS